MFSTFDSIRPFMCHSKVRKSWLLFHLFALHQLFVCSASIVWLIKILTNLVRNGWSLCLASFLHFEGWYEREENHLILCKFVIIFNCTCLILDAGMFLPGDLTDTPTANDCDIIFRCKKCRLVLQLFILQITYLTNFSQEQGLYYNLFAGKSIMKYSHCFTRGVRDTRRTFKLIDRK